MHKIIGFSLALLLAASALAAATNPIPDEHAPNEIIVKFRERVANSAEEQQEPRTSASKLAFSQGLRELNARYRVKEIKPLFKNFKKRHQRLKELRGKSEALLAQKERHIVRRLRRAPANAKIPALDRICKIKLDLKLGQSLKDVVAAYNNNPDVEYAELNYIISINLRPNDPYYSLQWPLDNTGQDYPASGRFNLPPGTPDSDIDAPEAWDVHTGSSRIIVAVIDAGADYNHRDLQSNMWVNEAELNGVDGVDDDENGYIDDIYGYDFINDDPHPIDDYGHGTHTSGIIAAEGDNGLDIAGVCWDGQIMALKFLGADGSGTVAGAINAFYYAVENGADITSNSWGMSSYSQAMEEAINYAHSQGVITVVAAGNSNSTSPQYPAYFEHVISVAATNSNDQRAPFSTYGDWVDIAAPGVDILSLRANGTSMGTTYDSYTTIASGTSMSCPHVAGACAFLLSANPLLTSDEVYQILMETVDPISPEICISGRINLFNAMLATISSKGRVILDHDYYACSSDVSALLADRDLKGNGTHGVTVTTTGGDSETIVLTEILSAAGIFTGTISTAPGVPNTEDGTLQVTHGQAITAVYEDTDDGTGSPATATDTAVIDCEAPMIFDVRISLPGREPRVRFETDEPTTAHVLCGLACGGPYTIEGSDSSLTTSHTVKLTGVLPETKYFFIIEAADAAGNETVETNSGQCHTFTTTAPDGEIYVPGQCPTIQEAIDNCWEGETVWVADGTYTGTGNRDIDFKGRSITVRSENGPENCIIDCNGTEAKSHRGFYFHSGEDANSVLAGFTITNGYVSGSWYIGIGGAIFCEHNSSPTITNCIITGNSAGWDGGGINNIYSSPTITNCSFTSNSAIGNDGGGINNESSSPIISNCTFSGNSAYDWGGAIRNIFFCSPTITNCTFLGNSADDGGAMFYFYECTPTITNCTFAGNSARNGNVLACDSWDQIFPSSVQLTNCIIAGGGNEIHNNDYSTVAIIYSNVQGGWTGQGNIDADPCFVDPGYWANANDPNIIVEPNDPNAIWIDGDYHLLRTSPCVDAASDANVYTDIEGNIRPFDFPGVDNNGELLDFDMGAYELVPFEAEMVLTPQMLNCNSKGKCIKAHFVLPEGFYPEDVDVNAPAVAEPMGAESEYINVFGNKDGPVRLEICFDWEDFCDLLTDDNYILIDDGSLEITVIGSLTTGQYFYGSDTIKIKPRR